MTAAHPRPARTGPSPLRPLHQLLTVQTVVVILVSINRLSPLTLGFVADNEFLRWVDLNNMLLLPLISLIAFYLLKTHLTAGRPIRHRRVHLALNLAFIVGVYLLGASYGDHEVTNYLHNRFCLEGDLAAGRLCQIIIFNDDSFSHWIFFAGFVLVNGALLLLQRLYPYRGAWRRRDTVWLAANALFIGAGIFANLAFEPIGFDLYVVALLAALALTLLWRHGRQPLLVYYAVAYSMGLVATAVVKTLA